ncbi:Uncharacterised protein [Mycobacteroides abscessus subsp. abscessus]|nr:Uncharacterised protein [Mycobacteroides abscessus subsp. abscessus]
MRSADAKPGRLAFTDVAVSDERRSLACRHWSRSWDSEPTAAVPAGSASDESLMPAMTWFSRAWSTRSPENSG